MQAFAVASRPAASLRTPSKGLPLASRPRPQKERYRFDTAFLWIRAPDAALVSPSAAQGAHETVGNVEILIGHFDLPSGFFRSAARLYSKGQSAHRFGDRLPHDGFQPIGVRETQGRSRFLCQRVHDGCRVGTGTASEFFPSQTVTGVVQVQPHGKADAVLILQREHPVCGAP